MGKSPLPIHTRVWRGLRRAVQPKRRRFTSFTTPEGKIYSLQNGKYRIFVTPEGKRFAIEHKGVIRRIINGSITISPMNRFDRGGFARVGTVSGFPKLVVREMIPLHPEEIIEKRNRRNIVSGGIKGMRQLQRIRNAGNNTPTQLIAVEEKRLMDGKPFTLPRRTQLMERMMFPNVEQYLRKTKYEHVTELYTALRQFFEELQKQGFKNLDTKIRNVFVKSFDPETGKAEFVIIDQWWNRRSQKK